MWFWLLIKSLQKNMQAYEITRQVSNKQKKNWNLKDSDNGVWKLRIIGFVDFVHCPKFKIITKHSVSGTGSVSAFRLGDGDTLMGPLERA
jgi:energy-converting hydrogenase Eha subunit G